MKRGGPLKRTPLNRGTKPLRRVSKTNSKPHRDRSVIDAYRDSHTTCFNCGESRDHIHHLFKGHRSRVDHEANIIAVCWECHQIDDSEPVEFKIRCLHWKWKNGELDVEALSRISGERLEGWLSRHEPEPDWEPCVAVMRAELVGVCERVGT